MKESLKSIYKFLSPKHQSLFLEYKIDLKPRYGYGKPPHKLLYEIINKNRDKYAENLKNFLRYREAIHSIKKCNDEQNDLMPCWNNEYLPGLDIIALYCFMDMYKPKRYIEIGSGNSTKVAVKSIKDHGINTKVTSIDPMPRAAINDLADEVIREPLEDIDLSFLRELDVNDILFIDNSHRCFPNSDVTVCFLDILPVLRPGVIVHFHDIYLPYDYPQFMADRFYSEQYLLACYLLGSQNRINILMPNFFVSEEGDLAKIIEPIWEHPNLEGVERHGGSFWIQIQ